MVQDLDVFLDVISLRSGDRWKQRIGEQIDKRARFFLFWSRSAKASQWVDWEWRYAARCKGVDAIDPVPLEPPTIAPPPKELAHLHFSDWTLMIQSTPGPD